LRKHFYILLVLGLTLSGFSSNVKTTNGIVDTKSIYKSMFIYNFATLVDWPSDYRKGDFVIGVYGDDEAVYDELNNKYSGKAIGSQKIKVMKYASKADVSNKPHILYISANKSESISAFNAKFKDKSTLLITDKPGYLAKGAIINFVIDKNRNNKQSYEIDKSNAKKHKLYVPSKLTNLAAKVVE